MGVRVKVISDKFSPYKKGELIDHKENTHLKNIIRMGFVEIVEDKKEPKKAKKDTKKVQKK